MSKGAMSQLQKYIDFAVAKKTAKRARETGREKEPLRAPLKDIIADNHGI